MQKAKENLRRKKGAEEIRRVFKKTEGQWGKKVRRHFVLECDLLPSNSYFVIKRAAS